jgi:GNAT superfamily N-acetyltransferase
VIRPFRDEDARAAVEVLRASATDWLHSPASLLHRLASHPPRAQQRGWVAEADGVVVGFARARLRWEVSERSLGWLWIGVRPEHRRQRLGGALYDLAATHLLSAGAERLETYTDDDAGRAFLEERGFRVQGGEPILRLEPARADTSALPSLEEAKAAEGFRLVPLAEALDRSRELHAVYAVASEDVPEESTVDDIRYEEWVSECLQDPDLARDGSAVVLHGETPVALAFVVSDGEGRAANDLTGTLPEFRRRGLARLAKLATIRWAAENGVEWMLTANAEANTGMRALNESLGYRPAGTQAFYVRDALS